MNGVAIDNIFPPLPPTINGSTTVPVSFGLTGDGSGTVTGSFAGNFNAINCGAVCFNDASRFGESWTFKATPNEGSVFAGYLARIIQEGSDIGRKTKISAWYKCC